MDVDELTDYALDLMCEFVQKAVGQTDGGYAGVFWSDSENRRIIKSYIQSEMFFAQKEPMCVSTT